MDIESLYTVEAHEAGAEVQINNPLTGKKTDIYIKVAGMDSKAYRKARHAALREAALKVADGEVDEDALASNMLAEATTGWRGVESKGKPIAFSKDKAVDIYLNSPSIRDQVDRFISDRSNFTNG